MKPLNDFPQLLRILKQYSPVGQNYAQLLLDIEEKNRSTDRIVPILGTQGYGKSTLINALLEEDILPATAGETTCVPIEIRYGEGPDTVFFLEDKPSRTIRTKQELMECADNYLNPGNQKQISHVTLYRKLPLLETGLVLVDLPGVGSLTMANQRTTERYIQKLSAAVFVVQTSPPILASDAAFIETVWHGSSAVYFVQNAWDDHPEEEIQEGLSDNVKILKNIAQKIKAPTFHPIIPVNVYAAAKGAFSGDEALTARSGIGELRTVLLSFAEHYQEERDEAFRGRVKSFVASVAEQIDTRIQETQLSEAEVMEQIRKERDTFEQNSEKIRELAKKVEKQLRRDKRTVSKYAGEIAEKYAEQLKTKTFALISQGIVDGERLSKSFAEYQTKCGADAQSEVYEKFMELQRELSGTFKELGEVLREENVGSPNACAFNKAQALKLEEGLDVVLKLGTLVGGIPVGTTLATAALGNAAIGGFALAGPVGIAAGIAIAVVGSWLGSAIREVANDTRGDETKREIMPRIQEFEENLKRTIKDSHEDFAEDVREQLDEYKDAREKQLSAIEERIRQYEAQGVALGQTREELERDKKYLAGWGEEL